MRFIDRTGQVFGRLTILSRSPRVSKEGAFWLCQCSCGKQKVINGRNIVGGKSISCGCVRKEQLVSRLTTHGRKPRGRKTCPVYKAWQNIISRCHNPRKPDFARYGARGITVCDRWRESFENFLADMGERPSPKHSIDRIDNNGNYEPGNCRWATNSEQQRNKRTNRLITIDGITHCVVEWAEIKGIPGNNINARLHEGWSDYDAVMTPIGGVRLR
jgi:hypothetical protein